MEVGGADLGGGDRARQGSCLQGQHTTSLQTGPQTSQGNIFGAGKGRQNGFCRDT